MTTRRFDFEFEDRYRLAAAAFGITPHWSWIVLTAHQLEVRYGPWHVRTPLDNIATVTTTGPYLFIKTAGPARLTVSDRGLTFASNSRQGVQLDFVEPITGIDPLGRIRHPNLTVTPGDCAAFVAALHSAGAGQP
jgi:hypothetical protein